MLRIVALTVLCMVTPMDRAVAEKRVALVIGNSEYISHGLLTNPSNDARLIGQALAKAGFDVVETKMNLGVAEFRQSLRRFQSQANGAEVALVYFAGHGIESNGVNWLIPTDAELEEDRDLEYEAIRSDLVLQALRGARIRLLVLDACRNNPFGRSWRSGSRSITSGLAKLEADDVLVLFAAAPGQTAADGSGDNSPFALALAKRLPQPGLALQFLGGAVRDDVLASTGGEQRPYVSASITGQPFYIVPGNDQPQGPAEASLSEEERKYFDKCVTLAPHVSRRSIVSRLATLYKPGSYKYRWRYIPATPNLAEGDYPITSVEALPDGILVIKYKYRSGRLVLTPVTLASMERGGATRGFRPRDTYVDGASLQAHGMWIQDSGYGCANFFINGETGEAAGNWIVADDAGKPVTTFNRIERVTENR